MVLDELAMLTPYSTDRDLLRRADTALRSLLALGRARGFVMVLSEGSVAAGAASV